MKKKTRPSAKATVPTPVPPQLAGVLALVEQQVNTDHADETGRALAAARAALADVLRNDPQLFDRISTYITTEADRGPSRELHRQLDAIERPEVSPHNATAGEYQNVYGLPALMIGMALAYVYLTEGGTR
jgi:hypothetical protein